MILTHKVQDPEKSSCAKWQQQQNDNQNSFPDLVFVVWLVAHCLGIHMKGFYLINFLKKPTWYQITFSIYYRTCMTICKTPCRVLEEMSTRYQNTDKSGRNHNLIIRKLYKQKTWRSQMHNMSFLHAYYSPSMASSLSADFFR